MSAADAITPGMSKTARGEMALKYPKPTSVPETRRDKALAKEKEWQRVRQCVLVRDGRRCRVCHRRDEVDVHHIRFRSVGGPASTTNCCCLCRVCHADVHGYRLILSGNANAKLKIERVG